MAYHLFNVKGLPQPKDDLFSNEALGTNSHFNMLNALVNLLCGGTEEYFGISCKYVVVDVKMASNTYGI